MGLREYRLSSRNVNLGGLIDKGIVVWHRIPPVLSIEGEADNSYQFAVRSSKGYRSPIRCYKGVGHSCLMLINKERK
jgi:hypothetical protein